MPLAKHVYLGDSVYLCADDSGVIALTTNDPRNRIVLEPYVVEALLAYVAQMRKERG